ncbi:tetratricopeptide repeat protein [Actinopolyspora halophila]|uniref:tetratricopeptide repeat protein n=1 Tax=Actinopolyspora halophila TaxID=1850 RepID=UPI00035D80ED|nr:tetratricopeptide repeat protein [Actinopolyspora halophila]
MRSRWFRALLLGGLLTVTVTGFLLSRPGWLFEDNSPVRNVLEALSWVFGILGVAGAGIAATWRLFTESDGVPEPDPPIPPEVLPGRALHLVSGDLPTVSRVGLLALGVKPAIDTDSEAQLPPFVPRDRDVELDRAIIRDGMVLVHGRAAAGKSRAALEALRRRVPNHKLLVPNDGPALREIAEADIDLTDTVIWLDDLERFLSPEGLDLGLAHRLRPTGRNTRIVATIRDDELARYDHAALSGSHDCPDVARSAVPLVEQLRDEHRINLARRLSGTERDAASRQTDHRIHSALHAEEGFAEYLAAGRAMFGRWTTGDGDLYHLGQAVISAAVDCRRAGYHRPLPAEVLEGLHSEYLAAGWRHRGDLPAFVEGLAWACNRVLGASSCLHPHSDDTYLASDYLLDSAELPASPLRDRLVPNTTRNAVLTLSTPQEALYIGQTAWQSNNTRAAEEAFRSAAESGDPEAMLVLGGLLSQRGREQDARSWFAKARNRKAQEPQGEQ